jgi:hypothetical protein
MTRADANQIPGMMATLASHEGMFGPYHPQTLAIATALGVALYSSDRHVEGKQLLERAAGDLSKHHGRHHAVRIRALEALSAILCQEGNWKAALPLQRELLECAPECLAARTELTRTLSALIQSPIS